MRTLMAVSAVALALTTSAMAQTDQQQRGELRKQLEIMNSIFSTALQQEQQGEKARMIARDRLSYNYLAGQGVVYRTRIGGSRIMFFDGNVPLPPMPEMPEIEGISHIELRAAAAEGLAAASEALENIEIVTEDVYGNENGNIRVIRTVTDNVRENAREVRELRRRERDLELAKENANGEQSAELNRKLEQVRAELRETEQALDEARAEITEAREQLREEGQARRAKLAEEKAERLAKFEQTMASTLCDYGRTLRALPAQEHVTFVIEGAGVEEHGGDDKIYIFSKRQLEQCQSPGDLLSKATTYSF
ncbi:hypothetical protein [Pseudidiomarina insulisalsae]|uniref:Uncharacterized protein n=1 Tax=Pseudidiomarina insulisalsae TaxID=575789 RepID=A0A432YCQ7_9GAMM|nr:hypothetical protein [Pseudidiomarina insulisalsae]RUO58707.1 hypothetical protein CWI71_09795 [Pseudidiomarina insulisalsae]